MAEILKNGQVHSDNWQVLYPEADADLATVSVGAGQWLVPFTLWQAQSALQSRKDIGVWLSPNDDLNEVAKHFGQWPLVAIDFPKFTDGRGMSIAYNLRARLGFEGELRAIGDVLRDQLFYMSRVGFNAFATREDRSIEEALKGLSDFSEVYQHSWDQKSPLFRRVFEAAQDFLHDTSFFANTAADQAPDQFVQVRRLQEHEQGTRHGLPDLPRTLPLLDHARGLDVGPQPGDLGPLRPYVPSGAYL